MNSQEISSQKGFPKMGVPLNPPFVIGFSILNHPFLGIPMTLEMDLPYINHPAIGVPPINGNHQKVAPSATVDPEEKTLKLWVKSFD